MRSDEAARDHLLDFWEIEELEFFATFKKNDNRSQFAYFRLTINGPKVRLPNGRIPWPANFIEFKGQNETPVRLKCKLAEKETREKWKNEFAFVPIKASAII